MRIDGPVRHMRPFKSKITSPKFILLVVKALAELKDVDENGEADRILQNFTTFFRAPLA